MKDIGGSLINGGAAVCVLVRKMTGDKVLERLSEFKDKGRVLQTSLSNEQEEKLRSFIGGSAAATEA
jgi:uncharacterized membrane protein